MSDWEAWLQRYDAPRSGLSQRLALVQYLVRRWLDRTAPRPVRVLSVCAGDGRDILQVLTARADAGRVAVALLESDARLCKRARAFAVEHGLGRVEVTEGDAGTTDAYAILGRFDLVLLVGVFGNVPDGDIETTIDALPAICAPDASVIWSRRPKGAILGAMGGWFAASDFVETFATGNDRAFHVAAHRFTGIPREIALGKRLFSFFGTDLPPSRL